MLTRLVIRNFKRLDDVEIELGNPVVFIGPNDSGKTSALQALTLWDLGLRRWAEKRGEAAPPQRSGVAVNRRDLVGVPVPSARHLWRELIVRKTTRDERGQRTENVRIEVVVDGKTKRKTWKCGLQFDYANEESIYCRPLRTVPDGSDRMAVPTMRLWPKVAILNPMSGLVSNETRLEPGAIDVRLGEGRTAEVLRNLCLRVTELPDGVVRWKAMSDSVKTLFGVDLDQPRVLPTRGEVEVTYRTQPGSRLDLSSAGRGMQQTLMLLAFINLHPGSVLLLDEPDAHLEILRQRQIYELLGEAAADNRTQVICASHSEVILNEAMEHDTVVSFVGSPHRIDEKGQTLKALREIGFEDYHQAEITGFVLYLEGSIDLMLLRSVAQVISHEAAHFLERPFVRYCGGHIKRVRSHFYGLQEARPDLLGYALFDHDERSLDPPGQLVEHMWPRREIENYLLPTVTLPRYAAGAGRASVSGPHSSEKEPDLFGESEAIRWAEVANRTMADFVSPVALRDLDHRYWLTIKLSDELLAPVLEACSAELGPSIFLRKKNYYELARCLEPSEVHKDVVEVLDAIVSQASRAATPR